MVVSLSLCRRVVELHEWLKVGFGSSRKGGKTFPLKNYWIQREKGRGSKEEAQRPKYSNKSKSIKRKNNNEPASCELPALLLFLLLLPHLNLVCSGEIEEQASKREKQNSKRNWIYLSRSFSLEPRSWHNSLVTLFGCYSCHRASHRYCSRASGGFSLGGRYMLCSCWVVVVVVAPPKEKPQLPSPLSMTFHLANRSVLHAFL